MGNHWNDGVGVVVGWRCGLLWSVEGVECTRNSTNGWWTVLIEVMRALQCEGRQRWYSMKETK
ncbi:unnamed protein product, partial [Schistosoma turkestanicum]